MKRKRRRRSTSLRNREAETMLEFRGMLCRCRGSSGGGEWLLPVEMDNVSPVRFFLFREGLGKEKGEDDNDEPHWYQYVSSYLSLHPFESSRANSHLHPRRSRSFPEVLESKVF